MPGMIGLVSALVAGGGIGAALLYTLHVWHVRRRFARLLEREACRLCGTPFSEAVYDIRSRIPSDVLARLDANQRPHAAHLVECHECGALNACADNGVPMRAWIGE